MKGGKKLGVRKRKKWNRRNIRKVLQRRISLCAGTVLEPHIAEDITQETFVKAIKAVDRFKGDCDIKVWLCQIAKNTYFTYVGKQNREQVDVDAVNNRSESQAALMGAAEYDFISESVDKEQAIKIHRILHDLPEPYKEVFTLRVFGELRFGQIADIFGKTESWARVTYHRARMMIMDKM